MLIKRYRFYTDDIDGNSVPPVIVPEIPHVVVPANEIPTSAFEIRVSEHMARVEENLSRLESTVARIEEHTTRIPEKVQEQTEEASKEIPASEGATLEIPKVENKKEDKKKRRLM